MNTERTSLRAAASPASSEMTLTGMPRRVKSSANACAPTPEASTGARSPCSGIGPSSAMSANGAPVPPTSVGQLPLQHRRGGVQVRVERASLNAGRAASAASSAARAALTESTAAQPAAAEAASGIRAMRGHIAAVIRVERLHGHASSHEVGRQPAPRLAETEYRDRERAHRRD